MARCFVYTLPNGQVAVVSPGSRFDSTPQGWGRRYHAALISAGVRPAEKFDPARHLLPLGFLPREIDDSQLPADRWVRDAWEEHPGGVRINAVKAAEIRARRPPGI